jgi:nucleoside phosphorylase
MAGLAGALDPDLKVGDVLVQVDDAQNSQTPLFHTSSAVLCTPEQKAAVFDQTRARAVEMESQIVRNWSEQLSIPFVAIRAISDSATDILDPKILGFIDEFGRAKAGALAVNLLLHPSLTGKLKLLRHNSVIAGRNLAEAVHQWLLAATPKRQPL